MYLLESGRGGASKSSFRIGAGPGAKVKLRSGRGGAGRGAKVKLRSGRGGAGEQR